MTTIRDIAKLSGYSVSTISRVLNNHPYVSTEKRQRVLAIIDELQYIPNTKARNLSYGVSLNVGVLVPMTNNSWFEQIISGIIEEGMTQGYTVTILPTNYDEVLEERYLTDLLAKAYDGIIVISRAISLAKIEKFAKTAPIVCCEYTDEYEISCVYSQREIIYQEVFEALKNRGETPVGLTLSRDEQSSPSMRRTLASYQVVFGEIDKTLLVRDCRNYEDGKRAAQHFAQLPIKPKVILTNGDEVAAGIFDYFKEREQIELIGQGDELLSRILNFSTILHPLKAIGQLSFQQLFKPDIQKIELKSKWIER